MGVFKLETVDLKKSSLTEKWVQEQIAESPSMLGLGDDIEVKDKERRQAGAGRLDLLLVDPETLKRYEVEIQLGETDESHIIRTLEYWDIERKLYPQYKHAAVIVAEGITSRFLNVIQMFNGTIPLIALKMTAYKVGDQVALTFVKVLDEITLGLVDEDEPVSEVTNRAYWEAKASALTLGGTDELLKLITQVEAHAIAKYNKYYIGLEISGVTRNFVSIRPKKAHIIVKFKVAQLEEDLKTALDEAGIGIMTWEAGNLRVRVDPPILEKQKPVLLRLIRLAWEGFGK